MAKDKVGSFNFGANRKPRTPAGNKATKGKSHAGGKHGNAWTSYTKGK